jgi:hypothetical protein
MMRPLRLAKIAAEAEVLRLRRRARRTAFRVGFLGAAAVFALAALSFAHVAVFVALDGPFRPASAAVIVLGGDLAIALVLTLLASNSRPGAIEREARQVREHAVEQLENILASAALAAPLTRLLGRPRVFGVTLAILLPRLLTYLRR